jgi:hypothetical protein
LTARERDYAGTSPGRAIETLAAGGVADACVAHKPVVARSEGAYGGSLPEFEVSDPIWVTARADVDHLDRTFEVDSSVAALLVNLTDHEVSIASGNGRPMLIVSTTSDGGCG